VSPEPAIQIHEDTNRVQRMVVGKPWWSGGRIRNVRGPGRHEGLAGDVFGSDRYSEQTGATPATAFARCRAT